MAINSKLKQEFNSTKRSPQMVVLLEQSLWLQPHIFNQVLLRWMRSKANPSNFAVGCSESLIDQFEILSNLLSAMVSCAIPNQGNTFAWTVSEQVLEKGNSGSSLNLHITLKVVLS